MFATTLILAILANSILCENTTTESYYDANKFVGKWYVLATMHPQHPIRMPCMLKFVTKDKNNIFTIFTHGVCAGHCNETSTGRIAFSTIYEIENDRRRPSDIEITSYSQDNELALYDRWTQDYYWLCRIDKMSQEFFNVFRTSGRAKWEIYTPQHRGCE